MTCPPTNSSFLYRSANVFAGSLVAKFSELVPSFVVEAVSVEPTICFTRPEWRSIHGLNFILGVGGSCSWDGSDDMVNLVLLLERRGRRKTWS